MFLFYSRRTEMNAPFSYKWPNGETSPIFVIWSETVPAWNTSTEKLNLKKESLFSIQAVYQSERRQSIAERLSTLYDLLKHLRKQQDLQP